MILSQKLPLTKFNICMKVHEDIWNGCKVKERTRFCHRTANYKFQRDVTKKKYIVKSYGSCTLRVIVWCILIV